MHNRASSPIILIGPVPPPFGGVSVHVTCLHQLLAENGILSYVLTWEGRSSPSKAIISAAGSRHFLHALLQYGKKAGIVHDHSQYYQCRDILSSLPIFMVMWTMRRHAILTIHDGRFSSFVREVGFWRRLWIGWYLRLYRKILVINRDLAATVQSLGVRQDRIQHVKTLLPLAWSPQTLSQEIEDFLRAHSPVWLVVGAFDPTYHYDIVADAFRTFLGTHPQAGIILVSGGFTFESSLRARVLAALAPLHGSVLEVEDLEWGALHALYSRVDLFVRSAFPDGDGLSMREAILAERPVVATETGERPRGVFCYQAEDAGSLLRAVEFALGDREPGRRQQMRRESLALAVQNFQEIMAVYAELRRQPEQ